MIKIRLSRGGRKNCPVFTIVAAGSRSPATGKFIERLGQYNPREADVLKGVNKERIAYWVSEGAEVSDTVNSLFKKHKIDIK